MSTFCKGPAVLNYVGCKLWIGPFSVGLLALSLENKTERREAGLLNKFILLPRLPAQVQDECTIRTNSPKFAADGTEQGCGQCTSKKENHGENPGIDLPMIYRDL